MTEQDTFRDLYCYACQRSYNSDRGTFSETWRCRSCDAPICSLCWSTGLRHCHEHSLSENEEEVNQEENQNNEEETEPESRDTVPDAQTVTSGPATDPESDDASPTENITESTGDLSDTSDEDRSIPVASPVEHEKIPDGPISRDTAAQREEAFLSRVEANVRNRFGIYNPNESEWLELSDDNLERQRENRANEIQRGLQNRFDEDELDDAVLDSLPLDETILWHVFTRKFFGGRERKVVICASALSPWRDLARNGESDRALPYSRVEKRTDKLCLDPDAFHYICLFATTGWEKQAKQLVSNGEAYVISLIEYDQSGAWQQYRCPDHRWGNFQSVFNLNQKDDQKQRILEYIRDHEFDIIMGRLTLKKAREDLGYSNRILANTFRSVASQDPFIKFEKTPSATRLIRTYQS